MLGRAARGFTLIELAVVVGIVAVLSAVVIPAVLSRLAEPVTTNAGTDAGDAREVPLPGHEPSLARGELSVTLEPREHLSGAPHYLARVDGRLLFDVRVPGEPVALRFPFPNHGAEARDVGLRFADGTEPGGVTFDREGIRWSGVPPTERFELHLTYAASASERFVLPIPGYGRVGELDVRVEGPGLTAESIPDGALRPTAVEAGAMRWQYDNLVSDRDIVLELPATLTPWGRTLLLCRIAALAVLLFGFGFWYLSELHRPGMLDDFRWGHFLLLAGNYSLFFVVFAIASAQRGTAVAVNLAVAGLVSVPLLALHVSRFVGARFALERVVPLAVFSLGLVVNGVYGGRARPMIFAAAGVAAVAVLTLTYRRWLQGRDERARNERRRRERAALRAQSATAVEGLREQRESAQSLLARAARTRDQGADEAFAVMRKDLDRACDALREHLGAVEALAARAGALDVAEEPAKEAAVLRADVGVWAARTAEHLALVEPVLRELEGAQDEARRRAYARELRSEHELDAVVRVHCIACGAESGPGSFCGVCGVRQPIALECPACQVPTHVPVHLLSRKRAQVPVHCRACGELVASQAVA